jgi:hypothetical protein
MLSTHPIADATLTIRDDENQFVEVPIRDADPDVIRIAHPYRTFRWYRGQRHYSGFPPRLIGVADCCCR